MSPEWQRRLAYGSNASLVTVFVLATIVLLIQLAGERRIRWSVSDSELAGLQEETLQKIRLLEQSGRQAEIIAFSPQGGRDDAKYKARALRDLMEELRYASPSLETRYVDFDRERLTAEALSVRSYGHIVIQSEGERVDLAERQLFRSEGRGEERQTVFTGEDAVAQSLARLLADQERVLYHLEGHGERSIEDTSPEGLSQLAALLETEGYQSRGLDLQRDRDDSGALPMVPLDASGLILTRPMTPLTPAEEDALAAFVGAGKPVLVMVDPGSHTPELLARLQVLPGEGVVLDRYLVFPYPDRPLPRYRSHPITTDLSKQSITTVLAHVAPLALPSAPPPWQRSTSLMHTSRDGWVELGGERSEGQDRYDAGLDQPGPVDMAVALQLQPDPSGPVQPGKRIGRAVIVGDSDFASNGLLSEGPGNASFALNAVRWMLYDDDRLAVYRARHSSERLALTEEDRVLLRWLSLGLLPGLVGLMGLGVWLTRRGRR